MDVDLAQFPQWTFKSRRNAAFSPARQRRAPWKKQQDFTQLGLRLLELI
jgi:hypothetical protein